MNRFKNEVRASGLRNSAMGMVRRVRDWMVTRPKAPSRLSSRAGHADFEALEARQLLFSLTIGPGDIIPGTGLGQVSADFGYLIPYLLPSVDVMITDDQVVLEDFEDELPAMAQTQIVVNGRIFNESNLQIRHNITPPTDVQLVTVGTGTGDNVRLQIRGQFGEQFNFRLNEAGVIPAVRSMRFEAFAVGASAQGLPIANIRIVALFVGQVVQVWEGAQQVGALNVQNPGTGVGQFFIQPTPTQFGFPAPMFDELRFEFIAGTNNDAFQIDDVQLVRPPGNFSALIDSRVFGARITLAGPVGSSVQLLDLYGREMALTTLLRTPQNGTVPIVDPNDDGVPEFNDGIGQIIIRGGDFRTSVTLFGATIQEDGTFNIVDNFLGLFDDFEQAGFGYDITLDPMNPSVVGLPPGPGSVIVGSPYVRNNTSQPLYNPTGVVQEFNFLRADQGVFSLDGSNVGSVYIHGVMHGVSRFNGAVDRISIGYFPGSLSVEGDLGWLAVGSDAGLWVPDEPGQRVGTIRQAKTGGELIVGRTVGEVAIAGRSMMDVTVLGDLNSPQTRPPRDVFRYFEREFAYNINVAAMEVAVINATIGNTIGHGLDKLQSQNGFPYFRTAQGPAFGTQMFRNDTLGGAEWVGSIATAVQIHGDLGLADPINEQEDPSDVYAFAVDGSNPVVLELDIGQVGTFAMLRVLDVHGRTVAGINADDQLVALTPRGVAQQSRLEFLPPAPGVYYAVVGSRSADGGDTVTNLSYVLTIGGMAPTTFGALRVGGGFGGDAQEFIPGESATVTLLSGSMGAIRIGTAWVNGDGQDTEPSEIFNADDPQMDQRMALVGGTFSVPGTLYQMWVGSDVKAVAARITTLNVGGDLGHFVTGVSPVTGIGPGEGDLNAMSISVGGRIGIFDVRGAIGYDQDTDGLPFGAPESINIRTGTAGGDGSIGLFRVGAHIASGRMNLTTSPGSTIGAFLVSQDIAFDPADASIGIWSRDNLSDGVTIRTGAGSDVRFVTFPRIDIVAVENSLIPIIGGTPIELTDDAGGRVRFEVPGAPVGALIGSIRVIAVDGSQGVAIGRIAVNLTGGLQLRITSLSQPGQTDRISIGHIVITGSDAQSAIGIEGTTEIDVWQIEDIGGGGLLEITNLTPGGDIVAIDVALLDRLEIRSGNLGETEMPSWGPRLIGPFIGIGGDAGDRAIQIAGPMHFDWNGQMFRPSNDVNAVLGDGNAYLDDLGSPASPYLNGLIVRDAGTTVSSIRVGGVVRNVVVQQGFIFDMVVNADRATPIGQFHGIVGSIYAGTVITLNVGDGIARRVQSPFDTPGVFANDDIRRVFADLPRAFISGAIVAGNVFPLNEPQLGIFGIGVIEILNTGGDFTDAYIATFELDRYFPSYYYGVVDQAALGNVNQIRGQGADFFRSRVETFNLTTFDLQNGFFDASYIAAEGTATTIQATGYRNLTRTGGNREYRPSEIRIGQNLVTLTTIGQAGDIVDTLIDVQDSVTNRIAARSIIRGQIEVNNTINLLTVTTDISGSRINTGRLLSGVVGRNLVTSEVFVAGPLVSLVADAMRNTRVSVTGPNGRLDLLRTRGNLSGVIESTGPVALIQSTAGDISARIVTTTERGNVTRLEAFRDLDINTDISGTMTTMIAGRHVGSRANPGVILVRGNLQSLDVSGGQLYADVRIGQALTGSITIGQVSSKPGANLLGSGSILAFGRIASVVVTGDFNGSIVSYFGGIGTVVITDGSFLPGNTITAFDGNIDQVRIVRGHLLGDIHADYVLNEVRVEASEDGIFGHIGVNPALNSNMSAGPLRNQLPPGVGVSVAINGPRITAGHLIGLITTDGGSMFETTIHAGRFIALVEINGHVRGDGVTTGVSSAIAAGDTVSSVIITGDAADLVILGGVLSFGADGRAGGTGASADTVKTGRVVSVSIGGHANNVAVAAGMTAGPDGLYGTADDRHALGISWVREVTVGGTVTNVRAFADSGMTTASPGIAIGGRNTPVEGGLLAPILVDRDGNGVPIWSQLGTVLTPGQAFNFSFGGSNGTILYTGPGTVIWNQDQGQITLANTTLASSLTVTSNNGQLNNFRIISNDDASLGTLNVQANLLGTSRIVIDGYLFTANIQGMSSASASLIVGNDIQVLNMGSFTGGLISAVFVRNIGVSGNVGGTFEIFGTEGISIVGGFSGLVSVERDLRGAFNVSGQMIGGRLRAGGTITSVSVGSMQQARVSAGDNIGPVNIAGNMVEGTILSGVDLGRDGTFGGVGANADRVTTGSMGQVTIGGDMTRSSIAAGVTRGSDGFFGTSSDAAAEGRSNIAGVRVNGQASGSNLGSESFRIIATGTIGTITFGGTPGGNVGNLRIEALATQPLPIQVLDLQVTEDSRVYTATIFFNQAMDASSLSSALSVSEVRDVGQTRIRLVQGLDYSLSYNAAQQAAVVVFSRSVTEQPLPQVAGTPGPGMYRFDLDQTNLRAQLVNARLDGNSDGFVTPGDHFSTNDIVGDAGDKTAGASGVIPVFNPQTGNVNQVSAYHAIDLNIILDNNLAPDGLPVPNREFTLRGSIGDHPNHDPNTFRFSGDVDVYRVTLQAGQILRLGKVEGPANAISRQLFNEAGALQGAPGAGASFLPAPFDIEDPIATPADNYLVKETGTYYLVVAATADNAAFYTNGGAVPNTGPTAGGVGAYLFTLEVFDDGDSGFAATTDAGNGAPLVNAPTVIAFAGPSGVFGTADDVNQIVTGGFTFTLDPGPDGVKGTADDVVRGTNGRGIESTRHFEGGVSVLTSTVSAAIGHSGAIGVPGNITPDVDIFHLNNRLPVQPGTKMRINLRLAEVGGDLGARINPVLPDLSGHVILALFETTGSNTARDAALVFAPTDFSPTGGPANTVVASDNATTYGYDENGDFYIEFIMPASLLSPANNPTAGRFAVYVQGVFNTDYVLEVRQAGTGTRAAPVQNIFIETRGGSVDWLEVNRETHLNPFSTRPLGFSGTINGQPADTFILQAVVNNLTATFNAAGVTVNISTNPADFEFQDFSTVFLTTTNDPLNFFSDLIFGYAQRSDPFNTDRNDEAVVFVPTFSPLGYVPSTADAQNLATSITSAMARRIGELVGLRIASNAGPGGFVDPMAANSVFTLPIGQAGAYRFSGAARALSTTIDTIFDTDFYLGNQLGLQLINQNVQ